MIHFLVVIESDDEFIAQDSNIGYIKIFGKDMETLQKNILEYFNLLYPDREFNISKYEDTIRVELK